MIGINSKKYLWYAIIFAIIVSLVLITIAIYSIEEDNLKNSVIDNRIEIQEIVAKSVSKNISSELDLILFELSLLANSDEIKNDMGTAESSQLIEETFNRVNSISPTAQILALDTSFKVLSQVSQTHNSFVGSTVRGLPELLDSEKDVSNLDPKVLSINTLLFDEPEIAITMPIIDAASNTPLGLLLVTLSSSEFFERHGNIYDIESQFLVVMDENYVLLIHPNMENVGKNFFGDQIQQTTNDDPTLNSHVLNVLEGNLSTVIFTLEDDIGERINSGIPVPVNDKTEFMFAVVTPTSSINQEIDEMIFYAKIQTVFLLLSTITVLLIFLIKRTQSFKKEKLSVIGQLSSNIAHDIRNPLGTIKNAGVIIGKENQDKNEIVSRELKRINVSVRRISHQIEEVLNYVRTTPAVLNPHSVSKTIHDAIDVLDVPENVKITTPKKDAVLNFDNEKILVVFVNIILNAIQSIGSKDGHIDITLTENAGNVLLEFRNSGPAIPPKVLEHVFDPLFTTKLEGTGLGLSSCKNIIEQHGGSIKASSSPVVFAIKLPR